MCISQSRMIGGDRTWHPTEVASPSAPILLAISDVLFSFSSSVAAKEEMESESTDLPTAQTKLASNFRLTAMCRACRRIAGLDLTKVVEQGLGDVPIIHLRLGCSNCRSKLCDGVVSGPHFLPTQR